MAKRPDTLTDNEWIILQVVWENEPCTAPAIQEMLAKRKRWAYTTVKTMMDRMVTKGLLKAEKIRTLYFYRAGITPSQAKKSEIKKALKRAFEGSLAPMMQFLIDNNEVSDQECKELEQLIRRHRRQKSTDKKD